MISEKVQIVLGFKVHGCVLCCFRVVYDLIFMTIDVIDVRYFGLSIWANGLIGILCFANNSWDKYYEVF